MERAIKLSLNRFATIPQSLRLHPSVDSPTPSLTINLASLFHHYYLDCYGRMPPDPNPTNFEYLRFLASTNDFRFRGDGLGFGTSARRNRSTELGQAFCRMFLHDHLGVAYFAHLEKVLGRMMHSPFAEWRVERITKGDIPDYFCAVSPHEIYLSEAKGSYPAVSFGSKKFDSWRQQFCRITVKKNRQSYKVKGFIVATRYATEEKPNIDAGMFAEDPETTGDLVLSDATGHDLGNEIIRLHYSEIAAKLDQPNLSAALLLGYTLPGQILIPGIVWECVVGPLAGKKFVGGYYQAQDGSPTIRDYNGRPIFDKVDPLRLDGGRGTFFGVEEAIFRQVTEIARAPTTSPVRVNQIEDVTPFYSAISLLRDGTLLSPIEFLRPLSAIVF